MAVLIVPLPPIKSAFVSDDSFPDLPAHLMAAGGDRFFAVTTKWRQGGRVLCRHRKMAAGGTGSLPSPQNGVIGTGPPATNTAPVVPSPCHRCYKTVQNVTVLGASVKDEKVAVASFRYRTPVLSSVSE